MTNKNFDFGTSIRGNPAIAVRPKKAMGAQQTKSVKTRSAIRLAIVISLTVALVCWLMIEQYIYYFNKKETVL